MSSNRISLTIGELIAKFGGSIKTGPFGTALKASEYSSVGVPLVSVREIHKGGFRVDERTPRIGASTLARLPEYLLREGDIVFARKGSVERCCLVSETQSGWFLGSDGIRLRPPSNVDSRYLTFLLQSPQSSTWLQQQSTGSTMASLNQEILSRFPLTLPSIDEQRQVADILSAFDDRIAVLHSTNSTLESIVAAVFKSWFIDFDPVRRKSEGKHPEGMDEETARLFPSEFAASELGYIPKGWRAAFLGEVCKVTVGGIWGEDGPGDSDQIEATCLRGVDLEHLRISGWAPSAPTRWIKRSVLSSRRLSADEVLIAASGAGPVARPLWIASDFEHSYGKPVVYSNFVKRLKCKSESMAAYLDRVLLMMRESGEVFSFVNGTSVPNLDEKSLLATKRIVVPPDCILSAYLEWLKPVVAALYSGRAQALGQIRDELLPRLISGQLRIPDAEKALEEALH